MLRPTINAGLTTQGPVSIIYIYIYIYRERERERERESRHPFPPRLM